jgi:hypothetical protein
MTDVHLRVWIGKRRFHQFHVEFEFGSRFRADKSGIPLLQQIKKARVSGIHPDGDIADDDNRTVTLDL